MAESFILMIAAWFFVKKSPTVDAGVSGVLKLSYSWQFENALFGTIFFSYSE